MVHLTPTTNRTLPQRLGTFSTLFEGLEYAAKGQTGYNYFARRGELAASMSYAEVRDRAVEMAQKLTKMDLERGSRFGLIAETGPEFTVLFFACQYAGLVPVPMPLATNLGGREVYETRLRGMIERSSCAAVAGPADMTETLARATRGLNIGPVAAFRDLDNLPGGGGLRPFEGDDLCYIQYSSGSTAFPRGVTITQRAITENARAGGRHGLRLTPRDRAMSWLPFYHDMGLVGFMLTPMLSQVSVDYLATPSFARQPLLWLRLISQNRSTISFSPTFGYELCVRRARNGAADELDLSSWRVAGVGGEMIRYDVLERFARLFEGAKFDETAFLPSYGLAESTLAVALSDLDAKFSVDHVDRRVLSRTGIASTVRMNGHVPSNAVSFVICGKPLPETHLEIRNERNEVAPERHVGRVFVKGPSLMQGYFEDPCATSQVLTDDGWLDTGDLGYRIGESIVITGRTKDLIIASGRNIWPQDIEWAIEKRGLVRSGDVVAFSVGGADSKEELVVLVQSRNGTKVDRASLKSDIVAEVQRVTGVNCNVVLVPPQSFVFTSSGKLSRSSVKARFVSGEIKGQVDAPMAADRIGERTQTLSR